MRHHDRGIDIQHHRAAEIGPGDLRGRDTASGCQLGPDVATDAGPGRLDLPAPGVGDLVQRTPHRRSRRDRPQHLPLVAQHVDVGDRLPAVGEHHRDIGQYLAAVMHRGDERTPGHRRR